MLASFRSNAGLHFEQQFSELRFWKNLRRYLSANTRVRPPIDFAETAVYEAITDPCVICLTRNNAAGHETMLLKGEQSTPPERIREAVATRGQTSQARALTSGGGP